MKYVTLISVEKIKDTDTGGSITALDDFVFCDFNSGKGFQIGGVDPLREHRPKPPIQTTLNHIVKDCPF